VEISVIHNPTKARSVSVTPMSPDDWEILEQHASFLENNLLSQLRATQKGQEINIWVLGRTKIRIRVGKSSRRPCWVELTRADETDPPTSSSSAVVIGPDTEVFVAPRPRGAQSQTSTAVPIAPSAPKNSIKGKQKQVELRLVPARVAAVWGYPTLSPEHAERVGTSEAALCSLRTLRRVRRKLGLPAEDSAVYVKVERVKDEESGTDRNGEDHGGADAVEDGDATEVWLVSWSEMPDSCVVLSGRRAEWDEWGGVR
jgi:peroxin-1